MKNSIILKGLFVFLFMSGSVVAQKSNLKVELTGFEKQNSTKVYVSVFNKDNFLETSLDTKSLEVSGDKLIAEFDLPKGEYAVSTYHDVNNNGELDRKFYGKPKEPYGFSRNVRPFGKPSFDKCKFQLAESSKTIAIKLMD